MSKEIKAIDGSTVHRICSGQVVLSLAVAVKELVENSIDAGANNISVKLKDHGSKLVEVVDDGEGVDESNFAALTQKYHTSKLRQFSDLEDVATFGFRGEALSSLCALCDVTIATRHKDAAQATLLKYDHHGAITSKSPCARDRGTTVSLHNLFTTLPVRHREFVANLKREFGKMITLLTGYCLVVTKVNISCVNFTEGGRKQVILNSQGSQAVLERIANVYGAKEAAKLLEIQQCAPTEEILEEFALTKYLAEAPSTRIEGYISSCAHGSGRSSTDRQFVFVNSRPCEMPKLTKLVNSTYHMFNRDQCPFLLINIHLERHSVDVNVTPDKRSVFVHHEKYLLAIVKCSLLAIFRPVAATYERQGLSLSPALSQSQQSPMSSYLSPRLPNFISADKGAFITPVKRTSSALGTSTVKSSAALQSFKYKPAVEKLSRGFRAAITPSDNAAAENELSRQISKDMFEEMKIIGQFNLGFIITQLGEDLFIVDQHAADEKYNFEMLQRDVVMETQRLLMPQVLELTAVNEMVLTENLEIFEKNGFGFEVDESLPLGKRVRLVSVPVSGSWQFGKEDVDELIFMLSDNPHTVCRPSKLRQMFASRACRKSVMVGTALTVLTMKKVVSHLGELHHPWNCPHGRPTMRHLINISILPD
ncbi:mismatch repair endonuclease PMS2 isoform X3 [Dermacentor variabilis]|uniref:mismatch repair endonuclease PMS2 isoform X3 n=1 Tax=Dermacentor variabilis TaxID=34621 RepID=UPI003F5B05C5